MKLFDQIRAGDIVTYVNRFGQFGTGRAVMRGPYGWVLNIGGKHGTPHVVSARDVVTVRTKRTE
jgi:hypothetical protein